MRFLLTADGVVSKPVILLALLSVFFACTAASPIQTRSNLDKDSLKRTEANLEKAASRVVNGEPVTDKAEYPFVVDLSSRDVAISSSRFCTATLIGDNIILTAAHCVLNYGYKSAVYATVGRIELDDNHADNKKAKTFRTVASIVHPEYKGLGSPNDVALMLLNDTSDAQKVRLGSESPEKDDVAWVVGYGIQMLGTVEVSARPVQIMPGRLQKTALRIMNRNFCGSRPMGIAVAPGMLCTAGLKAGSSACRGDSGGGLFLRKQKKGRDNGDNRNIVQVGIVSYGDAQCSSEQAGVFTDVSSVKEWIDSSKKRLQQAFETVGKPVLVNSTRIIDNPISANGKVVRLIDETSSVFKN